MVGSGRLFGRAVAWGVYEAMTAPPCSVVRALALTQSSVAGRPSSPNTYPRRMLFARATSELCDSLFPDVLAGFSYTPEELGAEPAEEDLLAAGQDEDVE